MFRYCTWILVRRSKNNFLPFSLKWLPVLSGIQTTRFHSLYPVSFFLFPFPVLYLTWECWPWSQWLDLWQLPSNSKRSHVKATAHSRCAGNAGTLPSSAKAVPFLSISTTPEWIRARGSGLKKIGKQEKHIK